MRKQQLKIKKDHYIDTVLAKVVSNKIYSKPTGCGFTTLELNSKRNSIIIEPNKPVIQNKRDKTNGNDRRNLKVRAVIEGVSTDDIMEYLNSDVKYKKLITTPESFYKVISAFSDLKKLDEMYLDYFMLIDECERIVQDVGYRTDIIIPMEHFFKFKGKAMVSATPIIPSDPRFIKHKFDMLEIKEVGFRKQEIDFISTNNTILSFAELVRKNPDEKFFVFLNSTHSIYTIIEYINIHKESEVFCSEDSKGKLEENGFMQVKCLIDVKEKFKKKFNFFTSRFNSAVDIEGVENPFIVILTDCFMAEHTMVDPASEVEQIIGRFRRPKNGTIERRVTHITNFNPKLIAYSREEVITDIKKFEELYSYTKSFMNSLTTYNARQVVQEMLDKSVFSKYLANGEVNHYMIDNEVFENKVRGHYKSDLALLEAYKATKRFKETLITKNYLLSDETESNIREAKKKLRPAMELILPILKELYNRNEKGFEYEMAIGLLKSKHRLVYKEFEVIGFEGANELNFNYSLVLQRIAQLKKKAENFPIITELDKYFKVGESYSSTYIKNKLRAIFKKMGRSDLSASIQTFRLYFKLKENRLKNERIKITTYLIERSYHKVS
ncbi:hypothetical protein [Pedobacter sp. GR22-10]|uniref:hypothetical protein n=1 Tax=Pedobacter sp. GR22-10 TaxID=2994472 RepID=UPI002245B369|nr:hypothetical protein [Pedobacter sp. GR22-10]MCX2431103.1 hypothetical protein [Pedobacter sp. GR22-10]